MECFILSEKTSVLLDKITPSFTSRAVIGDCFECAHLRDPSILNELLDDRDLRDESLDGGPLEDDQFLQSKSN